MQWSGGPIVSRECLSAGENMGTMAGGEREREGARCGCRRRQGSGDEVKRVRVPSSRGARSIGTRGTPKICLLRKGPDMGYVNPFIRSRGGGMVEEGNGGRGSRLVSVFFSSLYNFPQTPFNISDV